MTNALRQAFTKTRSSTMPLLICAFLLAFGADAQAQKSAATGENTVDQVPRNLLLQIITAEDKRLWDNDLSSLLSHRNAAVRRRAALAAGSVGDERSMPALLSLLQNDRVNSVRALAAFALGEIESPSAADSLVVELKRETLSSEVKGRVVEALGKIAASLLGTEVARAHSLGALVLEMLKSEHSIAKPDRDLILLGLTATLRAKPPGAGPVISQFLSSSDPRIRADAANILARLRLKDANDQLLKLVTNDPDPLVRANAARVLGATEDKGAFASLLDRALKDEDLRVRVSAIRSLAALKDQRAAEAFRNRCSILMVLSLAHGENEILEVAVMLGRVLQAQENKETLAWLGRVSERFSKSAPEVEIAAVRISPVAYLAAIGTVSSARRKAQEAMLLNWRAGSSLAQALGEVALLPESTKDKGVLADQAQDILRAMLDYRTSGVIINTLVAVHSEYAVPDVLRAWAAFKPKDLSGVLLSHLKELDVVVRATAAELLGELPTDEMNARALVVALQTAMKDELNDAALAILDSLAKQKSGVANDAIKTALDSSDHLIRRRAVALLKENGAGDYSASIGMVQSRNRASDYERAISRMGKNVLATVSTTRGAFKIELLPNDAPLNVDNFVQLAKRGYFDRIAFHRVVPNFVIQDGDPRGDGNGGPGYQIRCEINEAPFERGSVGMALSGKDTGGSQWFVTHSPQPHLDGGYTVFGNVVMGMSVVDSIARGNVIRSIVITEGRPPQQRRESVNLRSTSRD